MKETEIVEQIEKKKRKRPDLSEAQSLQGSGELVALQTRFVREVNRLPAIDTNNVEQVKQRIEEYYKLCEKFQMRPLWAGLAHALGVSRQTLWEWVNGKAPTKPRAVVDALKKEQECLAELHEMWMATGQINPVTGIFLGKNNFGYRDQSEVVITPNNPLGETRDRAEIEARYRDSIAPPAEGETVSTVTFDELPESARDN